jgi:pyruvate,water dikinase
MLQVRNTMGLRNVKLMIPFCRTLKEAEQVIAIMDNKGLRRGVDELELYVMCEIPSNVILANEFADLFDGFSIGSNDLTQLTLGVDRDSEVLSSVFDERNAAVKKLIEQVVKSAKAKGRKIGICGQAPSDYPEFCEFLVQLGIDSIALNPDAMPKAVAAIVKAENKGAPK